MSEQIAPVLSPLRTELNELMQFGTEAEALRYPMIDVGGFIVPGENSSYPYLQDSKEKTNAREAAGAEEAGPTARSRERSPSEAASGAAAHALNAGLSGGRGRGELLEYHPGARVTSSSPCFTRLVVPVGLFRSLPYRAVIILEVPHEPPRPIPQSFLHPLANQPTVPAIRAWAISSDGVRVRGHHEYPDTSICACMPQDWRWGRDPLIDYVNFCIVWIGKALHSSVLGWWPGRQHYPAWARVQRDMPNEYCGCGSDRRYGACCRESDLAASPYARMRDRMRTETDYWAALRFQSRPPAPFPVPFDLP